MDAAACIGCGACVAACPNAAAMLFTAAKITHLNSLPQGQPQRDERTVDMVAAMSKEALRELHESRRVRGRLPEEDSDRVYRPDEPRPGSRDAASPRRVKDIRVMRMRAYQWGRA